MWVVILVVFGLIMNALFFATSKAIDGLFYFGPIIPIIILIVWYIRTKDD